MSLYKKGTGVFMNISEELQTLLTKVIAFIPQLVAALVVFVAAILLANLAAKAVMKRAKDKVKSIQTAKLLADITRWAILILGIIIALQQVNFNVTGFLTGLGIAGFTLGFALQDIAKNFISGLLLLIRQPFQIGDAVELSGFEGQVMEITLRDTVVKTWDGEVVILPNSDVYSNPIKNFSGLKNRRRIIQVGVGYETDLAVAQRKILESVMSVEGVLHDPQPIVLATEFGASEIVLQAYFWVDQTQHSILQVPSDVIKAIKDATERESINIPFPIQTIRFAEKGAEKFLLQ